MHYFRKRLSEWVASGLVLVLGLVMLFAPLSLNRPGLIGFKENATFWIISCILIGTFRLIALFINGNLRQTPLVRFVGSCMGVGVFSAFAMNFAQSSTLQSLSFGIFSMAAWAAVDGFNAWFTIGDVVKTRKYE